MKISKPDSTITQKTHRREKKMSTPLQSPDKFTFNPENKTFSWEPVTGATSYRLVFTSEDPATQPINCMYAPDPSASGSGSIALSWTYIVSGVGYRAVKAWASFSYSSAPRVRTTLTELPAKSRMMTVPRAAGSSSFMV